MRRRLFIVRKDLNMSPGKLAAQIGHCVEVYYLNLLKNGVHSRTAADIHFSFDLSKDIYAEYMENAIVKTVCQARNKNQLLKAGEVAKELGLIEGKDFGFIYDKCLTELIPEEDNGTCLTCFWTAPLKDDIAHTISKKYHLYM